MKSWENALAELEARVASAEAALDLGGRTPVALEPFMEPAVTGPIPAALVPRATEVFRRGEAVQQRMEAEIGRIRTELRSVPRVPAPEPTSRFEARS